MKIKILLLVVSIILFAGSTQAQWVIDTVDNAGTAGLYSDIEYDSQNNPHVVYSTGPDVVYAHWNGTGWVSETLWTNGGWSGHHCALTLDDDGYPHIVFSGSSFLEYRAKTESGWTVVTCPRLLYHFLS